MAIGRITRLENAFGSPSGLISQRGDIRELFFNAASLVHPARFALMKVGQDVEFTEESEGLASKVVPLAT